MSTETKAHDNAGTKPPNVDDLHGLTRTARQGILTTFDALAPSLVNGSPVAVEQLSGLFDVLHALHALDLEIDKGAGHG